jgi:glyoxylase-like metal-dependent hydrolase (beta-lactamase superfamily II)
VFPNAQVLLPRADYEYFVAGQRPQVPRSACEALRAIADSGRAELLDGETVVSREVTAIPAPGHTPGHTLFAVADGGERAMLIGDSMYCPVQLSQLDAGGSHDSDPVLARQTREMIAHEAAMPRTRAVGAHFAGGQTARLVHGRVVLD